MSKTHKVRTKMWPDRELEVGDAELLDLKRQGLLVEKPAAPVQPPTPAQPTSEPAKAPVSGKDVKK